MIVGFANGGGFSCNRRRKITSYLTLPYLMYLWNLVVIAKFKQIIRCFILDEDEYEREGVWCDIIIHDMVALVVVLVLNILSLVSTRRFLCISSFFPFLLSGFLLDCLISSSD